VTGGMLRKSQQVKKPPVLYEAGLIQNIHDPAEACPLRDSNRVRDMTLAQGAGRIIEQRQTRKKRNEQQKK
jgi:hypothetical protein